MLAGAYTALLTEPLQLLCAGGPGPVSCGGQAHSVHGDGRAGQGRHWHAPGAASAAAWIAIHQHLPFSLASWASSTGSNRCMRGEIGLSIALLPPSPSDAVL